MRRMEPNENEDISAIEPTKPSIDDTAPRRLAASTEQAAAGEKPLETPLPTPAAEGGEEVVPLPETIPGLEETLPPPPSPVVAIASPQEAGEAPAKATAAVSPPMAPKAARKGAGGKGKVKAPPEWLLIPALGLIGILLVALVSAFGGYAAGIEMRRSAERTQVAQAAAQQYELALKDMEGKYYDRARQRLEYVLQLDPNYPGATDKLAEVLLFLNATATPTAQPTPTITPTPDLRAIEELFKQANQALLDKNWDEAIASLLALRKKDPNYRTVDVDGMLFIALRHRGAEKITKANLEGGIYDLTLASEFAPLDSEAQGLLTWSRLYITGASFWELDWAKVVEYFSQVAPQMPYLTDSSGMTANERYRIGLFEYGNQLAQQGQVCQALDYYRQSLAIAPDPAVQQAFEQAAIVCEGGQPPAGTPKPGKKPKVTPTATP